MNALPIMLGALCVYALGYRYYSAFIAAKVLALDDSRVTPAHTFKDGCTGCAICALVCPDAAITVYREVTKAVPAAT